MKSTPFFLLLSTLICVSASETHFWRAGHLVTGDQFHFRMQGTNQITGANMIDIDPHNGGTRVLPEAVGFSSGLAFSPNGDLFVTDGSDLYVTNGRRGQIVVMRNTNNFFEPISITAMERPLGLALATNGDLYTTVQQPFPAVLRIKQDTGEATVVSSGLPLYGPIRIAISRNGNLFVCNRETPDEVTSIETNDIIQIDPNTGAQTIVTAGGLLQDAGILAMDENDNILVADQLSGLIRVNSVTGEQTLLTSKPALGVTPDGRGGAYFTFSEHSEGRVYHYIRSNGSVRTVSARWALWNPTDITVAPSLQTLLSALVPCESLWRSRGDYVFTVVKTIGRMTRQGIITPAEGRAALAAALTSNCGRGRLVR